MFQNDGKQLVRRRKAKSPPLQIENPPTADVIENIVSNNHSDHVKLLKSRHTSVYSELKLSDQLMQEI
jgi:hypothetical protein